jgi:hypothetical protein
MANVVGKPSGKLLAALGLGRGAAIEALMRDLGLSRAEAERYQAVHSGRLSLHA